MPITQENVRELNAIEVRNKVVYFVALLLQTDLHFNFETDFFRLAVFLRINLASILAQKLVSAVFIKGIDTDLGALAFIHGIRLLLSLYSDKSGSLGKYRLHLGFLVIRVAVANTTERIASCVIVACKIGFVLRPAYHFQRL